MGGEQGAEAQNDGFHGSLLLYGFGAGR